MLCEIFKFQNLPEKFIRSWRKTSVIDNYFKTIDWFDVFIEAVVRDKENAVLICLEQHDKTPALIFPVWIGNTGSIFSTRKIRSLSNFYSGIFSPIYLLNLSETEKKQAVRDVVKCIQENFKWDIIELHPLIKNDPIFHYLVDAFSSNNCHVSPYFAHANWYQTVNKFTYNQYLSERPSRLQNTIKRKSRRNKKQFEICFNIYTDYSPLNAINTFNDIYYQRWNKGEPYPDFINTLFNSLAESRLLRLGILKFDEKPVAVQVWIVYKDTAYIYKLAHLREYNSYSPGTILTSKLFEYVIDVDRVSSIDFLTGDEEYKSIWMDNRQELWGIQVANKRTFRGLFYAFGNRIRSNYTSIRDTISTTNTGN